MRSLVMERFGEPDGVLSVQEAPVPAPKAGEVLVRMIASPVNPSDLLNIRGRYVITPPLPATPGFEGVGVVERAGPGILGRFVLGKRVLAINGKGGNWADYAIIPARQARPVPADIPDEQAACAFVNPGTAVALARYVLRIPKGGWLLQSGAGSELGKMLIRLGRHDGFRTINVVRRADAKAELTAIGADAVISTTDGSIEEQVRSIVGASGVGSALDCVGGETGTGIFDSLGQPGRLVIFGSLSGEPVRIDPRRMITGRRVIESFWLGDWMRRQSIPKALRFFREVFALIRSGVLTTEVGSQYGLEEFAAAARAAETPGRKGKVLLRIAPPRGQVRDGSI